MTALANYPSGSSGLRWGDDWEGRERGQEGRKGTGRSGKWKGVEPRGTQRDIERQCDGEMETQGGRGGGGRDGEGLAGKWNR